MTATVERRKEVLALAKEHNFLILEGMLQRASTQHPSSNHNHYSHSDDPYFYLYYGSAPRPPSYFALEAEEPEIGRVLRFDSLSKILSSGIRIGFTSGPAPLLTALDTHVRIISIVFFWNATYSSPFSSSDRYRQPPSFFSYTDHHSYPLELVGL